MTRLLAARDHLAARITLPPRIALTLGSGLGVLRESINETIVVPYADIPGWPQSTVEGHAGRLLIGSLAGTPLAVMQGRVHLYEGYNAQEVAFPVRVLGLLGCEALIVTNAAGAINRSFKPGDLMLISDHLNLQGQNPCSGSNLDALGPRFFDMTHAYNPPYRQAARRCASEQGLSLQQGVYAGLVGPSFETPAEIRMLRRLGADAVGMSTVPEVIAAVHAGLRVVGISCMTNMAAGVVDAPLSHTEVMQTAARVRDDFTALLAGLTSAIAKLEGWVTATPARDTSNSDV